MTTTKTIQSIDLENYEGIARRMFPASRALAICDCSGTQHASSDESVDQRLISLREIAPDWAERVQDMELIATASNHAVVIMNLQSANDPAIGFLLWWVNDTTVSSPNSDLHDTLASLAACIRTELELQTELDSMALELAGRYDELNLVYNTDDQVSYFREGHEAFRALTQNCGEYLNAGLAILYLRDKGLFVESHSTLDNTDVRLIRSVLDDFLYDQVLSKNEAEFLNNEDEPDTGNIAVPYRIMAGPLISFGEHANGVLVIANLLSERPFSNSDKNLLAVMSRKAAKIVQGSYDGLTGLINRTSFQSLLDTELVEIRSNGGCHCVMHLNVDQLHRINETLGHEAGDMVIRTFGMQIASRLRDTDWVGRLGGDEFGLLIHGCDADKGEKIAKDLLKELTSLELNWQEQSLIVTASIGVSTLTENSKSGEQVLKDAVLSCDLAKEQGGNAVHNYAGDDTNMRQREASMWMVGTVHKALREDLFLLYAQPIMPLKRTGRPHLEILLRMQHDDEILAPSAFLPASERYQLMTAIDQWVVKRSLQEISRFLDAESAVAPVFGINLSGQSIGSADFLNFLMQAVIESGVPGELLCFEVTETAAVSNIRGAQKLIAALQRHDCKFALDDFGVGLSSFAYLKSFDVDYLKIDGALVRDVAEDRVSAAMVESINQIAHVMELETIAEFVETAQVRNTLAGMGVDYVQGYLLGTPLPLQQQLEHMQTQALTGEVDTDMAPIS